MVAVMNENLNVIAPPLLLRPVAVRHPFRGYGAEGRAETGVSPVSDTTDPCV